MCPAPVSISPLKPAPGIAALRLADVPSKPLRADQLRVQVHAAGVNFFDLLTLVGKYQIKPPLPFIPVRPGSEATGVAHVRCCS